MLRWPMVELGKIAPLLRRPVVVEPKANYREIGIRSHGKGIFHKTPVSGLDLGGKKVFTICPGDLLFNIVFAWEGAVAVAGSDEADMIGSHRFLTCVVNPKLADAHFIRHFFMTPTGLGRLRSASPGGAGRNRTLGLAALNKIQVPLPPLKEQHRIVERLGAVSTRLKARAEAAERQQAELAAMLDASFAQIIVDVPRVPMAELAPLIRRPVTVVPDRSYDELGVRSFGKGTFHKPAVSSLDIGNKRIFRIEPGDLIFSNVFAWEGAIAIARPEDAGRVGSHRFITCNVDQRRVTAEILRFFFLTRAGLSLIGQASPGGAGRNRTLGLETLGAIRVPVPSLEAQRWFNNLHAKVAEVRTHQAAIAGDATALLPSMLAQIFG